MCEVNLPAEAAVGLRSFAGETILVTGGAGLIGSTIVDQLVALGPDAPREIRVLDNFDRGRRENLAAARCHGAVTVVDGDIRDQSLVNRTMRGVDVVFHQAAIRITQCAEDPRLATEIMVGGTYNVVEAAQAAGARKIVAASSASIYGQADQLPTPETQHPYDNRTIYGAAKLFNEGLMRSFNDMYGLDYVMLRYFNVYGPRMDIHGVYTEVLIRWMERMAEGLPPIIMGDGLQTMDFVFVTDIARANVLAARSAATDVALNVATGVATSLNDLARALGKVMGCDLEPIYQPARKVNAVPHRKADVSKARELIGFEAHVSLEEGLRQLVGWWQAERAGAAVASIGGCS
jgi:UDP-glucose 4-epimerase